MDRLATDPALEVMPNFASEAFAQTRQLLANAQNLTDDEITIQLSAAWTHDNETRREHWALQQEADAQAQEEANQAEALLREAEAHAELAEAAKKKPKLNPFDEHRTVSDSIIPRPSSFALNKIKSSDYVELWYFTPEGCKDAANNLRTMADETFGLAKIDNMVTIRSVSSSTASRNALQDQDLTW